MFESVAKELNLTIIYAGFRESNIAEEDFIFKETVTSTNQRPESGAQYFDRYYHGKICSTQVHLNLPKQWVYSRLQQFYQLEPLIPILFSNSIVPDKAHCFRLILLEDSFKADYDFFGFPSDLPKNEENYLEMQKKSKGFFRDYSLIVPRVFGTWEFRSACSQREVTKLHQLLEFRIAVVNLLETGNLVMLPYGQHQMKKIFREACLNPKRLIVQEYLAILTEMNFFEKLQLKILQCYLQSIAEGIV